MRDAVSQLLAAIPEAERSKAQRPFADADRFDWHYTPRSRNGVSLKELDARGRESVHALLRVALSSAGYRKVQHIIELENVLREIELTGWGRDPERYHLTVYGRPDAKAAWGWRFEGHHLSLNFTLAGDHAVADTPSFLGANPARVRKGRHAGLRALGEEEDAGLALLASLSAAQRAEAIFSADTFGEILTRNAARVDPLKPVGIPAARLDEAQRARLQRLIEVYAGALEPALAAARLARVRAGGMDSIRFGWAGATESGRPHHFRIQGAHFLIEYDASQSDGNHIHTVWRDFQGDFGRDLLREHYQAALGSVHRH
jgi:hypothetical protein